MRILVVEDEQLIRWSLASYFKKAGYEVLEAATGGKALEDLRRHIDLVLLDLKLPDIDGLTILAKIKQDHPDCPVILMTAYRTTDTTQKAEALGVYRLVDKPFELVEIAQLAENALRSSGQNGAGQA